MRKNAQDFFEPLSPGTGGPSTSTSSPGAPCQTLPLSVWAWSHPGGQYMHVQAVGTRIRGVEYSNRSYSLCVAAQLGIDSLLHCTVGGHLHRWSLPVLVTCCLGKHKHPHTHKTPPITDKWASTQPGGSNHGEGRWSGA